MAVDKLVDSSQLDLDLTSVANAIRAKSGGIGYLLFPSGFVSEINSIAGGPTLDDWLADTVGEVTFNGYSIPQYAFAGHKGPSANGIAFSLPNAREITNMSFAGTVIKSLSAPGIQTIINQFAPTFPPATSGLPGVIIEFPLLVTMQAYATFNGIGKSSVALVPALLRLANLTGRPSGTTSNLGLFGASSYGTAPLNDITEITQDPQKNVLPQSNVRVYCPALTSCLTYDFANMPLLVTVELPNMLTVGQYAFYRDLALTTVDLRSATTIGQFAFQYCTALTTIDLRAATSIGGSCFYGDTALTAISLPLATTIGESAFYGCTALEEADIGNVAIINTGCFRNCTSLEEVTAHAAIGIATDAFNGCTNLTTVTAPSITSVAGYAFYNCGNLASIDLTGVTSLTAYAFYRCNSLISVDLKSATSIPRNTFVECTALKTVTLRKKTNLNDQCFYNSSNLDTLIIDLDDPTGDLPTMSTSGTNVFRGTKITTSGGGHIYVNDDRVDELKAKTNWTSVASLIKPLSELPSA